MAVIVPFKGITYNFNRTDNIAGLFAPPYDVISEEDMENYYKANPYNVIRLILGKNKTGDTDWDNKYTRAAEYFHRWQSENILIRAKEPAMYLVATSFDPGDGKGIRTRWGFIALVRIEDEDSGVILPHERTFSAHKDDRLKLMKAANAQFSQIFGIYEDPEGIVSENFRHAADSKPQICFKSEDGIVNRMWIIENNSLLFKEVSEAMKDKKILIADGHHRYETARNFRDIMRIRYGKKSANRSYEYVMMFLTNLNDRGLTILPSHRLIRHVSSFDLNTFFEKLKEDFDITELPFRKESDSLEQLALLKQEMETRGRTHHVIGFYTHMSDKLYLLTMKSAAKEHIGDDLHPVLKDLDVLILSRLVLQKCLGFSKKDLDNEEIFHYTSDHKMALSSVQSKDYEMAFLLNPTKIDQVRNIAEHSLVMPRKSTYFYPKITTGLVFNKIDPDEIIPHEYGSES